MKGCLLIIGIMFVINGCWIVLLIEFGMLFGIMIVGVVVVEVLVFFWLVLIFS